MRPASLSSRTLRVWALALALVAAGGGLRAARRAEPSAPPVRGLGATVPEAYESPVADAAASGGGVSDADDWLG